MQPPKIDFRFSFYTSKNMYLKNYPFLNANLLEKYQIMYWIWYKIPTEWAYSDECISFRILWPIYCIIFIAWKLHVTAKKNSCRFWIYVEKYVD